MTSPAFSNTTYRLIKSAMEDAGLLQDGDEPTSEQYAKYLLRFYDLITFMQTGGLKLWLQTDQAVTLVAGQASYTMMTGGNVNITKPMRVLQGYYLDSNAIRRPLVLLSRDEYTRLSITSTQGAINSFFIDKLQDRLTVYFWLVPDATAALGTAHLLIQRQITSPISLTEDVDFPTECNLALRWGLADDICTGQPQAIMDRCAARALTYRTILEDWDVEDTGTQLQPDSRGGAESGRFR